MKTIKFAGKDLIVNNISVIECDTIGYSFMLTIKTNDGSSHLENFSYSEERQDKYDKILKLIQEA